MPCDEASSSSWLWNLDGRCVQTDFLSFSLLRCELHSPRQQRTKGFSLTCFPPAPRVDFGAGVETRGVEGVGPGVALRGVEGVGPGVAEEGRRGDGADDGVEERGVELTGRGEGVALDGVGRGIFSLGEAALESGGRAGGILVRFSPLAEGAKGTDAAGSRRASDERRGEAEYMQEEGCRCELGRGAVTPGHTKGPLGQRTCRDRV